MPVYYYRNHTASDMESELYMPPIVPSPSDFGWSAPAGAEFEYWNTSRDGTGTRYDPYDMYGQGDLYAIWSSIGPVYPDVTYNRNLTAGDTVTVTVNNEYVLSPNDSEIGFTVEPWYTFLYWEDENENQIIPGTETTNLSSTTLNAIWQETPPTTYKTTDRELTSIANAIRTKGGTSSSLVYPAGFVSAIGAISTGTDVSDTTATASDVRTGKYFYTAAGVKTQGSIANQAAQTITPTTTDQTIASGKYLTGTQTIKGDANLVAGNIKKDVQIFGVTGTHEGGGGGNILHEYAGDFIGSNEGIFFNVTDSLPVAVFDEDHSPTILLSVGDEIYTLYAYFNSSTYSDGTFELIGLDTDFSTGVVLPGDCPVIQNGIIKTIHVSVEYVSDPGVFYEFSNRLTIIDRRVS